jgi:hypothetical protein
MFELFPWFFWNTVACTVWALAIFEDPKRAIALVFLVPLQIMVNLAICAILRRFRISGLAVVYFICLMAGLIFVVRYRTWWALLILVIPVARVIWSIRRNRAKSLG